MGERNIRTDKDRIGRYFEKYLSDILFSEMSGDFISDAGMSAEMRGIPVPISHKDTVKLAESKGLSLTSIAENMAMVIGCNPQFEYADQYTNCLEDLYGEEFFKKLMQEGKKAASEGDFEKACIRFRAALCMKNSDLDAMFSYARICRQIYESADESEYYPEVYTDGKKAGVAGSLDTGVNEKDQLAAYEEYVGRFKAESLEYIESITQLYPEFDMGHYFLGYGYLNMGLYKKAEIAWKEFMKLTERPDEKQEIQGRLEQLEEPVKIEDGCNDILAGRYEEGIVKLEPYATFKAGQGSVPESSASDDSAAENNMYNTWWPLYFYLGIAYEMTDRVNDAIKSFKTVLLINPSHIDSMEELVEIYRYLGDEENIIKYSQKIELMMGYES